MARSYNPCGDSLRQKLTPIHDQKKKKNLRKVGTEGNFLNLTKSIHGKPHREHHIPVRILKRNMGLERPNTVPCDGPRQGRSLPSFLSASCGSSGQRHTGSRCREGRAAGGGGCDCLSAGGAGSQGCDCFSAGGRPDPRTGRMATRARPEGRPDPRTGRAV